MKRFVHQLFVDWNIFLLTFLRDDEKMSDQILEIPNNNKALSLS